ncbi:MAG: aminotransferase class V-fold PLP-dependent enzyme [Lachnospiraceae bacterium]|nr:aminotransferase class V-fold PLP-dependent enzyme [Lachnospiraceae bacterium]
MKPERIYFDNAATTFPKPPGVARAVSDYIENIGCNVNRGSYAGAYDAGEIVFETRNRLKNLFNVPDETNIVFTPSDTYSLNMLVKGLVRPGDHVLVSSMEHNAVMRPVEALSQRGMITYDILECGQDGTVSPEEMLNALENVLETAKYGQKRFRGVILNHGSNVCGSILPIETAGSFCREYGIFLIVDCAQTAGVLDIDMEKMKIDALSFSGHKGLYGPQGTGGFAISDRMKDELETIIEGGTGSFSHLLTMPEQLPDRFEAGTMNIPGIYGLNEGLKFIEETGIDSIRTHENIVTECFVKGFSGIEGMHVAGTEELRLAGSGKRLPVVSITCDGIDPATLAYRLESEYNIWTRVGLHCAPMAHKTIGTFPAGTVRFSFGYFNTTEEAEYGAQAVRSICERR